MSRSNGTGDLPTMDDVAATAGVSRALVSLVFRDSPKVSAERRQRVLDAAKQLGYRPNAIARDLASRRSGTVGVLLNDLHNPFFAGVYDGVEIAAGEMGLRLVLTVSRQRDAGEHAAIETMLEQRVDGMILASPRLDADLILDAAAFTPIVVVGREVVGPNCDSVMTDEVAGADLVVRHLHALGHRSLTHIDGGRGAGALARRRGVVEAAAAIGIGPVDIIPGDFTESAGVAAARELLARPSLPTAVFAANDLVAIGLMATLEEAGVQVPNDISLVGFDNTALARLRHVALTTVDQSCPEMGHQAMDLLRERSEGVRDEPTVMLTAPRLVTRRSTAAPRTA